jgi:hypothetical protein
MDARTNSNKHTAYFIHATHYSNSISTVWRCGNQTWQWKVLDLSMIFCHIPCQPGDCPAGIYCHGIVARPITLALWLPRIQISPKRSAEILQFQLEKTSQKLDSQFHWFLSRRCHILQCHLELHWLRPAAGRVHLAPSQETAGAEHGPGSDPENDRLGPWPKWWGKASNSGIYGDLKAFMGIWPWILMIFGYVIYLKLVGVPEVWRV